MNFGRILITGGAGFLGSQLVEKMLPLSEQIFIIDDLSTGNLSSIPKDPKIVFYHGSITNEKILDEVLPNVEFIFHLACRNLILSYHHIDDDFQTNLYGGLVLLKKSYELSKGLKRFVYTSTASVYGNADILPTPESYYNIKLPYSASKFSTEHYCHVYHQLYNFPTTILRLSNVYGPGQLVSNPYCGVVAKFFEAAKGTKAMTIYGDGEQTRDFTYIEDALQAILLVASNDKAIGNVYNVVTQNETSVLELAQKISVITKTKDIEPEFTPKRSIDVVRRRCLNNKNLRELGWKCNHDIYSGLVKTYSWSIGGGNI